MDETEITNSEYRQFVNWVRDSVVRHEIAKAAYEKIGEEFSEDDPLWEFMPIYNRIEDGDEKSAYQEYLEENGLGILEIGIGPDLLEDYEGFFIPADSTPNGLRAFKTKRIKYAFREFDIEKNKWSEYQSIEIYPDTTVWYKDFEYSYNEP